VTAARRRDLFDAPTVAPEAKALPDHRDVAAIGNVEATGPETPAPWLCPTCGAVVKTWAHRCAVAMPERYVHSTLLAEWREERRREAAPRRVK
jgi:hypothetical protein